MIPPSIYRFSSFAYFSIFDLAEARGSLCWICGFFCIAASTQPPRFFYFVAHAATGFAEFLFLRLKTAALLLLPCRSCRDWQFLLYVQNGTEETQGAAAPLTPGGYVKAGRLRARTGLVALYFYHSGWHAKNSPYAQTTSRASRNTSATALVLRFPASSTFSLAELSRPPRPPVPLRVQICFASANSALSLRHGAVRRARILRTRLGRGRREPEKDAHVSKRLFPAAAQSCLRIRRVLCAAAGVMKVEHNKFRFGARSHSPSQGQGAEAPAFLWFIS